MNEVFKPFLRRFVLVFFDDILVHSTSWEGHLQHLTTVLGVLHENQLYANEKKCCFGRKEVAYLGHIISAKGIVVDPEKIQAMVDWTSLKNIKELRGFLGLTGYYRRFIHRYAHIAAPLTAQLRKDNFLWNSEAESTFVRLKEALLAAPVLGIPNFSIPFVVEADASGKGIGAVLSQAHHPLAYFNKALGVRGEAKSIYEKELMAIVLAVQKWRHYLIGRHFVIWIDQKSLKFIMEQRQIGTDYQK